MVHIHCLSNYERYLKGFKTLCNFGLFRPCLDETQRLEMMKNRASMAKLSAAERARQEADLANQARSWLNQPAATVIKDSFVAFQIKSMMEVKKTSKPCPSCKIAIDKFAGCNKVKCASCDTLFCWRCLKVC